MFTDRVTIHIKAGRGGDGKVGFRSSRGQARGGPDGGDGGRGGDVLLRVSHNTSTLSKYRVDRLHKAEDGVAGSSGNRSGRAGAPIDLFVPPGTVVLEGGVLVCDLTEDGQEEIVAHGGSGGFGNAHFTSSTRQAPKMAEFGEPGEERELILELKLLADVGLVGLPNAGKSTLLSVISNAKPEIANYPFTTLIPNLGVVDFHDRSFLTADIPGLIEGAAEGKGLGDEFLRHIERTKVLLHLIDATSDNIVVDYQIIQVELKNYQVDLSAKPQLVVLTKADSLPEADIKSKLAELLNATELRKSDVFTISSLAKKGLDKLLVRTLSAIDSVKPTAVAGGDSPVVISLEGRDDVWRVARDGDTFVVLGTKLERFAAKTNFDQVQAIERLRDILKKEGVLREIKKLGGDKGSSIRIGRQELTW